MNLYIKGVIKNIWIWFLSTFKKVKRGDLIGYVGSTGRSSAPHLHYEIFKDKVKINPINFYYGNLTAKEYDELLKQASVVNQSLD